MAQGTVRNLVGALALLTLGAGATAALRPVATAKAGPPGTKGGTKHATVVVDSGAPVDAGAPEEDEYARRWRDGAKACERLVIDPIDRLLFATPPTGNESAPACGEHSPAFCNAALGIRARPDRVKFLVATVPDPTISGMYYTTDR